MNSVTHISKNNNGAAAETPSPSPEGELLLRVFRLLDAEGVPYCVLHGYCHYPASVPSDVDMLIPASVSAKKLAELLHANRQTLGARIVQWFDDGAIFIVLVGDGPGPS